jgi:hypothetical protein
MSRSEPGPRVVFASEQEDGDRQAVYVDKVLIVEDDSTIEPETVLKALGIPYEHLHVVTTRRLPFPHLLSDIHNGVGGVLTKPEYERRRLRGRAEELREEAARLDAQADQVEGEA